MKKLLSLALSLVKSLSNGYKRNARHTAGKGKDVAALPRWKQLRQDREKAVKKSGHRFPLCA